MIAIHNYRNIVVQLLLSGVDSPDMPLWLKKNSGKPVKRCAKTLSSMEIKSAELHVTPHTYL